MHYEFSITTFKRGRFFVILFFPFFLFLVTFFFQFTLVGGLAFINYIVHTLFFFQILLLIFSKKIYRQLSPITICQFSDYEISFLFKKTYLLKAESKCIRFDNVEYFKIEDFNHDSIKNIKFLSLKIKHRKDTLLLHFLLHTEERKFASCLINSLLLYDLKTNSNTLFKVGFFAKEETQKKLLRIAIASLFVAVFVLFKVQKPTILLPLFLGSFWLFKSYTTSKKITEINNRILSKQEPYF